MASGAAGLSGFALNPAERCHDSRIRLRSPGSSGVSTGTALSVKLLSRYSCPARAARWRGSAPTVRPGWIRFFIELLLLPAGTALLSRPRGGRHSNAAFLPHLAEEF